MIQTLVVSKEPTVDTAASGETSQLRRSTMGNETDFGSIDTSKHSFGAHVYRRRSSLQVYRTFLGEFYASTGGWLLIVLGFLISLGIGSLIGVVPRVATQRFAEINYGLEKGILCSSFSSDDLPLACVKAAAYAQSAASYSALARNLMGLFLNSFAGSYSDTHGRRGELSASKVAQLCTAFCLKGRTHAASAALLAQRRPNHLHPADHLLANILLADPGL